MAKLRLSVQLQAKLGLATLLQLLCLFFSAALSAPIKLAPDFQTFALAHLIEAQQQGQEQQYLPSQTRSTHLPNEEDQDEQDNPIAASQFSALAEDLLEEVGGEPTSSSTASTSTDPNSSGFPLGGRKSNFIRLPNGQSVQFCDENKEQRCKDKNAICEMGTCVCRPGFFSSRQLNQCQSIGDLMKNCENDHQCQAFNVDLICDTKSHERPFCDCADGLHFDQETHTCLPCHRNTLILTTNSKEQPSLISDQMLQVALNAGDSSNESSVLSAQNLTIIATKATQLRPCRPIDITILHPRRWQQHNSGLSPYSTVYEQPFRGGASTGSTGSTGSSSDPFRIKTPLEVFMGAIMLFTLFTVAWFFLQRMIHDCRAILRSLRNPDFNSSGGSDQNFSGQSSGIATTRSTNHHYLDPTGQAVARLFSSDSCSPPFAGLSTSLYQPDLTGVMVQHLTANLSPSSTNHALVSADASRLGANGETNLYSLGSSSQQSRHAAAAAAAQLLLSPSHPAIAILRAAAVTAAQNPNADCASANFLNSMFDPPPKYEEAIAQQSNSPAYQMIDLDQRPNCEQARVSGGEQNDSTMATDGDDCSESRVREEGAGMLSVYVPASEEPLQGDDLLAIASTDGSEMSVQGPQQELTTPAQPRDLSTTSESSQRRQNSTGRRVTRRSRRDRSSLSRTRRRQQSLDGGDKTSNN